MPKRRIAPAPVIPGRGGRPEPPRDLSERERQLWFDVINSRPLHFFGPETLPLVRAYVMHAALSERLAEKLRGNESNRQLRHEFGKQTMALCALASKLRLAKQQRRLHQTSEEREASGAPKRRLWVVPGGDDKS